MPSTDSRCLATRRVVRPSKESARSASALSKRARAADFVSALLEDTALEHVRGGEVAVQIERAIDILLGRIDASFLESDGGARIVRRGVAAAVRTARG